MPPNGHVTQHLVGTDGVYAGPLVIAVKNRSLFMGIHDDVALGRVHVATGFAEGEVCWTVPPLEVGASGEAVSDKGEKLTVKRVAYAPITM